MIHVRPRQVFTMGEEYDQPYRAFLPPPYAGSIITLEQVILIKLLKLTKPKKVFEFGTYRGDTTRLLLENLDELNFVGERVFTLDIASTEGVTFQGDDELLANISVGSRKKYETSKNCNLVRQIYMDSMLFNANQYSNEFEYIFIDGNHELKYVANDTEKALTLLNHEKGVVFWHDYGNPQFPELTEYLDEKSKITPLYHIIDTMLVMYLRGFEVPSLSEGILYKDS